MTAKELEDKWNSNPHNDAWPSLTLHQMLMFAFKQGQEKERNDCADMFSTHWCERWTDRELMQLALDALQNHSTGRTLSGGVVITNAAIALRERLVQLNIITKKLPLCADQIKNEMTREEIIEMIRENGPLVRIPFDEWCHRFAALVAAKEREACAKVCEVRGKGAKNGEWVGNNHAAGTFAAAIRNRSNT